jgi:hypothetical protein
MTASSASGVPGWRAGCEPVLGLLSGVILRMEREKRSESAPPCVTSVYEMMPIVDSGQGNLQALISAEHNANKSSRHSESPNRFSIL